jgi:coenzyme F420 hydrogenase subunit beta
MYSPVAAPALLSLIAFVVLGLLLVGGLLYGLFSTRARLRLLEEELEATKKELQQRSIALADAESEIERLKRIPKAELLPMLKLAHEQRSPLAAIQNALDMLLQGYAANNPQLQEEMVSLARDRAATMLDRVNDFLRLGSVRQAEIERKVQPVQLLDVLRRMEAEKCVRARWRAVDLRVDVPDSLPPVTATYEDMEHLLSNLINNAIKYTNPGGKVTVSLKEEDGKIVGAVEDTGIGISPDDLPRIFDEFYRAESARGMDAQGTGLGLAIVKRVVDLYDGQLDVESELGKGSKFTFSFPKETLVREAERTKTFCDLQEEVIRKGVCSKCGACLFFCSAGKWNALTVGAEGFPCYVDEGKCLKCGMCYLICPLTRDLDAEVRRRSEWRPPIGVYQTITSARATEESILRAAVDGGAVTALLLYMLDNYIIQGAIVSRKTAAFSSRPLIATTREELISAAGFHFAGSSHPGGPDDEYTTYLSVLSAVKDLEGKHLSCVAMVGTPCQVRTVRKMQCLGLAPANVVGYTIGLLCMGNLSFDAPGRKRLEDRLHVDLAHVDRLHCKDDLGISLRDGTTVHVPFEEVDEWVRPACLACTEFANDYADIAVGGLGSPDGYTTALIRTEKGNRVFSGALRQGYVVEREFADPAELRSERTKMMAKVVAFAQRRRERGEARLRELGNGSMNNEQWVNEQSGDRPEPDGGIR